MAFTRKFLSAMGIEADKVDEIINAHIEVVDGLKEERDNFKKDAEKLADVQKQLNKANEKLAKNGEGETVSKEDYDKLKGGSAIKKTIDFLSKHIAKASAEAGIDTLQEGVDITAKNTRTEKENAFRELLKSVGVSEKRFNAISKVSDIDGLELDKDGKIKNAEKHTETIKSEWADFIETTTTRGADTANPPDNNGKGVKTKEEIYKMENGRYVLSASERQAELAKLYQSEKGD